MSGISIYDWIFAIMMCTSFFIGFLSIPSIISIKKIGLKNYIKKIKYLINLYGEIDTSYALTKTNVYNIGHNGRTFKDTTTRFFYPIYKDVNNMYIIDSNAGFFESIGVSEFKYNINREKIRKEFPIGKWDSSYLYIKTSTCIVTQLLIDRFKKKLSIKAKKSIHLNNEDELNKLLNSESTSSRRDYLLNKVFNG